MVNGTVNLYNREYFKVSFLGYVCLITNIIKYYLFILKAFVHTTIFLLLYICFDYFFITIASYSNKVVILSISCI